MDRTVIITLVVATALVISAFSAASLGFLGSVTLTTTNTTTIYTTSSCTITAPSIGASIRILTDSGKPIEGALVSGQSYLSCNAEPVVADLGPVSTNSSGWASIFNRNSGTYFLSVDYAGTTHAFAVPTGPTGVTYVNFRIPSGNLTSCISYSGVDCLSH
jgi:hypothetical protein